MCEPISLTTALMATSIAMSAAGTAASLKAQSDQQGAAQDVQNNQIAASNKQMDTNRTLATQSFMNESYQTAENLAQTRAYAADQSQKEAILGKQAAGQELTSAAAGGVEGEGIQSLLDDFKRQEGVFNANLQTNLAYKKQQTDTTFGEEQGQYSGRIASVMPFIPEPIAGPNYLGGIAGMGKDMANTLAVGMPGLRIPTSPPGGGGSGFGAGSDAFNKTVSQPTFDDQDVQY